jgi:hypothetical protein
VTAPNQNLILAIQNGAWQGKRFAVPPGQTLVLGRGTNANITISVDKSISSVHFEIENRGDSAVLRDLGSRNKTYVNRNVVSTSEVKDGDVIRAGATSFRIEWEAIDKDLSPPPPSAAFPKLAPEPPSSAPLVTNAKFHEPEYSYPSPSSSSPYDDIRTKPVIEPVFGYEILDHAASNEPVPVCDVRPASATPAWDSKPTMESGAPDEPDTYDSEVVSTISDIDISQFAIDDEEEAEEDQRTFDLQPKLFGFNRFQETGVELQTLYRSPEDYFPRLIELLRLMTDFIVVAHFRKLGKDLPKGLETISLFPDLENASLYLPVGVSSDDWIRECNHHWTRELVKCDGIVVAIASDGVERLRQLGQSALPGVSAEGGMVAWFWPSYLHWMLHRVPRGGIASWIGEKDLALIYPNTQESVIECISKNAPSPVLTELGF